MTTLSRLIPAWTASKRTIILQEQQSARRAVMLSVTRALLIAFLGLATWYAYRQLSQIGRWHRTLKQDCIRPQTPLSSVWKAHSGVARSVQEYNELRLHSGIGYIVPKDRLEGREEQVWSERQQVLGRPGKAPSGTLWRWPSIGIR